MHGLTLHNRDLVLGQGGFQRVSGGPRIAQDLAVATLEPFGCDRFHPGWGSVLSSYLGSPATPSTAQVVLAEVDRLVSNAIAVQNVTVAAATAAGRSNPYHSDDLITGVSGDTITQSGTSVGGTVSISTAASTSVAVKVQAAA